MARVEVTGPIAYAGEPGAFAEDAVLAAFGDVERVSVGGVPRGVRERRGGPRGRRRRPDRERHQRHGPRELRPSPRARPRHPGRGRRPGQPLPGRPAGPAARRHRARLLAHPGARPGGSVPAAAAVAAPDHLQHRGRRQGDRRSRRARCGGRPLAQGRRALRPRGPRRRHRRPTRQPDPVRRPHRPDAGPPPSCRPGRGAGRRSSSPSATNRARCWRSSGHRRPRPQHAQAGVTPESGARLGVRVLDRPRWRRGRPADGGGPRRARRGDHDVPRARVVPGGPGGLTPRASRTQAGRRRSSSRISVRSTLFRRRAGRRRLLDEQLCDDVDDHHHHHERDQRVDEKAPADGDLLARLRIRSEDGLDRREVDAVQGLADRRHDDRVDERR